MPGDGRMDIIWEEPEDIGSRAITNYRTCVDEQVAHVRNNTCDDGGVATWTTNLDTTSDKTDTRYRTRISGLDAGTAYFVGVGARNGTTRAAASVSANLRSIRKMAWMSRYCRR